MFKGLNYEHKEWVLRLARYGSLKGFFMNKKSRSFTWRGMEVLRAYLCTQRVGLLPGKVWEFKGLIYEHKV